MSDDDHQPADREPSRPGGEPRTSGAAGQHGDRAPGRRGRGRRVLCWASGLGFSLVLAVVALLVAVHTEPGTRALWQIASRATAGAFSGTLDGGTLAHGLRARDVRWQRGGTDIRLDRIDGQWRVTHLPWRLSIQSLRIGTVEAQLAPAGQPATRATLPQRLTVPLQVQIHSLDVAAIRLHEPGSTIELSALHAHGSSDGRRHHLVLDRLQTPYGPLHADVALDGVRPFAVRGETGLSGQFGGHEMRLGVQVSGSLQALVADMQASGMQSNGLQLNGVAHVEATPFADVPLKVVTLDVDRLDPRAFNPGAPHADLSIRARLRPVEPAPRAQARGAAAPDMSLVVAGEVSVVNAVPGLPAQQRLPLIDARTNVRVDASRQILSALKVRLLGGATVSGAGALEHGRGRVELCTSDLDLSVLSATLRTTRLAGPIGVELDAARQQVQVDLADADAKLRVQGAVSINPRQLALERVRLTAGDGHAELAGVLRRDEHSNYELKATLAALDPFALLARDSLQTGHTGGPVPYNGSRMAPKAAGSGTGKAAAKGAGKRAAQRFDASVTGTLNAKGALTPTLTVQADFAVRDSVYNGLPLNGGGTLALAGTRIMSSDVHVSVAGNDIQLRGSFGAAGDRLLFHVDAPALERLGFGMAGAAHAKGDVTGSLAHPNVVASYQADGVVMGGNRIGHAAGRIELRDGAQGAMIATLDARAVTTPQVRFNALSLRLDGVRAHHTLIASGNGSVGGQPVDFNVAASGKLTDARGGIGWDGTIRQLENRGLPEVKLAAPATVSASAGHWVIGATRLSVERALLDLKSFQYAGGRLQSSGSLAHVDVARLLQLREQLTHQQASFRTDLVFDAQWDVSFGPRAAGYVQIKRRSGDVTIDAGRGIASLGISDAMARIDFAAGRRLNATVQAVAERLGTLDATLRMPVAMQDGVPVVAGDAPLDGTVVLDLPSLRTTGGLLGPSYRLDGQMLLKLAIAGQVSHPKVSGTLTGDGLSATIVDQGITLKDGIVRVVLTENQVEFRQVQFHGAQGTLRATGNVMLDQQNPDLSAHIVADQLELFASPYRQLSLSGDATVANAGAQGGMAINGRFFVNKALFDLPEQSAPSLSDDVVIVRPDGTVEDEHAAARADAGKPAGPFAPRANIDVDLGQNFRFRGAGADLGLRGVINLVSAPNQLLRAVGNVRVVEGSTYTAFGRKLGIENGYFTFNGPVNDPGINILAMRRNQEIEAGVQVTGTVQSSKVKLVSEPNVNDNEKLSWLLLGHGTDTGANLGQQSTMNAAIALLGSATGKRIAQTFGLDEVSVGQSEVGLTDPQVVTLSKAITERLVLGYEQGIETTNNAFKVTVNLSRFWAIMSYAGTYNGVDLQFTRRFDGFWKK
ncbi:MULTISPECIES: translocation/assembly module TamB domain-containing protein [Mycetohabitans]|uniref:translocation/assembly module TamB domain-containing protein n=1 Tax=Mycetohabitans TaxID=2571159 RepID=UPI001F1C2452|nr:translocation/assembly module TamB domain-containing protein [Mycetohabitans sp. B3]